MEIAFLKKYRACKNFKIFCPSVLTIVALYATLKQVIFSQSFSWCTSEKLIRTLHKIQRERETNHKIHHLHTFGCWKSTPYQEVFQKLLKRWHTIKIYNHNIIQSHNIIQRSVGDYCKQSRHRGIGIATQQ